MTAILIDLERRRANLKRLAELIAEKQAFVDQFQFVNGESPPRPEEEPPTRHETKAAEPTRPRGGKR